MELAAARTHRYSFLPLAETDLPLVRRWLLESHVRRWWDDGVRAPYPDVVIAEYREAMRGDDPSYHHIARIDGDPVGLFQHYRIGDHPEYAGALGLDEDAVGVDLFIGEPGLIGRGHGPPMLRAYVRDIALPFHRLDVCVIGPSEGNLAAIRAYEKAGFTRLRAVSVPHETDRELLLRITRADLDAT